MAEQMTIAERFAPLEAILEAAHYSENGIAAISRELVGEIRLALKDARTEIDAKDKRIAELEGLLREGVATLQDDIAKNNALKAAGDMLATSLDKALTEAVDLKLELVEVHAKVARLKLPAEAWDKREALVAASKIRDAALWEIGAPNTDRYRVTKSAWLVAEEEAEAAAARAREAART